MSDQYNLLRDPRDFLIFLICYFAMHGNWELVRWLLVIYRVLIYGHQLGMPFGRSRPHHETSAADYRPELNRNATTEGRLFSPIDETFRLSTRVEIVEPLGTQDTQPHDMPTFYNFIHRIQRTNVFDYNENNHINEDATLYDHSIAPEIRNERHNQAVVNERRAAERPVDEHTSDTNLTDASIPEENLHSNIASNEHELLTGNRTFDHHSEQQTSIMTETRTTVTINNDVSNQTNPIVDQPVSTPLVQDIQPNSIPQDEIIDQTLMRVYLTNTCVPKPRTSMESSNDSEAEAVQ